MTLEQQVKELEWLVGATDEQVAAIRKALIIAEHRGMHRALDSKPAESGEPNYFTTT